jgi:DNA-3-methyladenine glycosylase II
MDELTFTAAVDELVARDADLRRLVDEHGRPRLWTRPAGFPALVLLILEQQVSLASAAAAYGRVLDRLGAMAPELVLAASPEDLRADGVSRQKDRYLRGLSEALVRGSLDLDVLATLPDDEARRALVALPGIGVWTADVYLLACLGRPDLWPVGDRALQVATAEALGLGAVPGRAELDLLGERWRPVRSTAARLLWHGYLARRGRADTTIDPLKSTIVRTIQSS